MKMLTRTITIAALCVGFAACEQGDAPAHVDDTVSASEALRAFAGTWRPTAGTVTTTSRVDGVHLDAHQHERLGLAMADVVGPILHRVPLSAEQAIQ